MASSVLSAACLTLVLGAGPGLPAAERPAGQIPAAVNPGAPATGSARAEGGHPPPAQAGPRVLAADLFTATLGAARNPEVRMGGDYVIGPGDQLALTAFGTVEISKVLTVDRGGKVIVPGVGILDVAGQALAEARASMRALLTRRHAGVEQFDLEVVGLHDVQVFVLGEVDRPGSYLVSGASSAATVLGLAGGPGPEGSWRAIRHLRGGEAVGTVDLYALRFQGAGLRGPGFQDGDCLFVPLAGRRILARGAFKRTPASEGVLIELKDGERAGDALAFAGGLVASASRILLTVQRTSPEGVTTVTDIPNEPAALAGAPLFDADVLTALPRRERADAFVELAGAVSVPGRFAFREGMRVADLLTLKAPGDQVLPRTYRPRGEILRTRPDGSSLLAAFDVDGALRRDPGHDLPLQPRDRVELSDVASLRPPRQVTVLGPLARPGTYEWHEGMRASDLLFKAGVPHQRASKHEAELARFREGGGGEVRRLDLARLVATEAGAPVRLEDDAVNPRLDPFDQITVYEDPRFSMHPTVQVTGQVLRPGPYVLTEASCTLSQLIRRAGGLTGEAMPTGGVFLRARAKDEGAAATGDPIATVNDILQRLNETRRTRETGALEPNPLLHGLVDGSVRRLVVDIPAALGGDPRRDVALEDGDRVHIPRRMDSAYVVGEVASAFSSFHVKPGDRVWDILKLAGGYTRNADCRQVRLLKASGRIVDTGVERAPMEPGDALLVPQRIRKDVAWQDTLLAMTPLAILYNALRQ